MAVEEAEEMEGVAVGEGLAGEEEEADEKMIG